MQFSDLGLSELLLKAVAEAGYSTPTPIQAQAIPQVLMGRDVLACAQTGTGKTASFTLPMIDILAAGRAKARMPRSLILEPTRELAAQVSENFRIYGKNHKLTMALLIGGESLGDQMRIVDRGVDVLIATPGRLIDVFERGGLLLQDVKVLVIDEADRMLDMGFIPDVERIVGLLPRIRQTLFLSATMPPEIRRLADAFLMNPREITVARPATTAATVSQSVIMVHPTTRAPGALQKEKRDILRALLREEGVKDALVFCNRKRDVNVVYRSLLRHGFNVGELHGDMAQPARMATLDKFKKRELAFLVCSDVAARGLDIPAMDNVINFDVPTHAEDYVHRIGRTGRAGRLGRAVTLAAPEDGKLLRIIEQLIGNPIERRSLVALPVQSESIDDHTAAAAGESADDGEATPRVATRSRSRGRRRSKDALPPADKPNEIDENAGPADSEVEDSDSKPAQRARSRNASQDDGPVIGTPDASKLPASLMRPIKRPIGE
jgi:superfamily II DNA/RNA helicase